MTPTELGLSWDGAVMIQQSALFSTGGAWYQKSFADEAPDIELKYLSVRRAEMETAAERFMRQRWWH